MRRLLAFLAIVGFVCLLGGCTDNYKWHYFINRAYVSDFVNVSEGNYVEAGSGFLWVIIDITLTNFYGSAQYPRSDDFFLVVGETLLVESTILPESEYGMQLDHPVEAGESIRFELYFHISKWQFEMLELGFGSMNSFPFVPTSLSLMEHLEVQGSDGGGGLREETR